ncbi:MAG: gliding motility-associated C-terminal domain-containing protein [Bacteroidota bacterium]
MIHIKPFNTYCILLIAIIASSDYLYAKSANPDSTKFELNQSMILNCDPNFENANLEGSGFPNGWTNCFGTVDIQPGAWGVTEPAAEGLRYFGFHSNDFDFAERPQGALTNTLVPGETYYLKFKFAIIPTPGVFPLWGGGGYGDQPGYLDVYASTNHCGTDELIGSTPIISSDSGWVEYEMTFTANFAHNLISFNPKSANDKWVYMGLDDLQVIANPNELNIELCQGQNYSLGSATWTEEGSYYYVHENALSCDSVTLVNLNLNPNFSANQSIDFCEGDSWTEGNDIYTLPGTYSYTHVASNGCDSTITTTVNVNPSPSFDKDVSICEGDVHQEGNDIFSASGNYSSVYVTQFNCDSIVNVNLSVWPNFHQIHSPQICDGNSYEFNGTIYESSDTVSFQYTSTHGCDSLVELQLTVSPSLNIHNEVSICQGHSHIEGNSIYSLSGVYTDLYLSGDGCDSIVTTELTVLENFEISQSLEICDGQMIEIGDNIYTENGIYTDILISSQGCDSIVETALNIIPKDLILDIDASICEGESYEVNLSYIQTEQIIWSDNTVGAYNSFSEPGIYYVDVLLDSCYVTDTIQIYSHYQPHYTLNEINSCRGEDLLLELDPNNGNVTWQDGSQNTSYIVQSEGVYTALVENACGAYSYTADVSFEDCNCSVFIPNSFTPDGDGANDIFQIHYSCDFIQYELNIFDRWGKIVFNANNPDIPWTGELETKGYIHNSNVYNYILTYSAVNSEGKLIHDQLRGHLTQIR